MSTWRAKRFSAELLFGSRRYRVTVTVRRFRVASTVRKKGRALINVRFGRLRQLQIEHRRLKRRKRAAHQQARLQMAVASMVVVAGFCGLTYSVATLTSTKRLEPISTFSATAQHAPTQAVTLPKSVPTHITIASQQIDADLVSVGLNADGSIELPPVLDWVAGWYKYSPTPGELGPSVIVGHVDNYQGISVFWNLRYVQPGDAIDITRVDGSVAHFKVTQLAEYDQHTFPTDKVYGNTADAELHVITCGGTFDTSTGHYTENTVVYATLVS